MKLSICATVICCTVFLLVGGIVGRCDYGAPVEFPARAPSGPPETAEWGKGKGGPIETQPSFPNLHFANLIDLRESVRQIRHVIMSVVFPIPQTLFLKVKMDELLRRDGKTRE